MGCMRLEDKPSFANLWAIRKDRLDLLSEVIEMIENNAEYDIEKSLNLLEFLKKRDFQMKNYLNDKCDIDLISLKENAIRIKESILENMLRDKNQVYDDI